MSVAAADVDFPLVSDHGTTETGLKHRGNLRPFVFIRLIPAIAISLSSHLEGLFATFEGGMGSISRNQN